MNPYEQIAKPFYDVLDACLEHKYTHYWLKGGRGSTKSSFIGLTIPLLMMIDGGNGIQANAVVMRKVGDTLANSVYTQILWRNRTIRRNRILESKNQPIKFNIHANRTNDIIS